MPNRPDESSQLAGHGGACLDLQFAAAFHRPVTSAQALLRFPRDVLHRFRRALRAPLQASRLARRMTIQNLRAGDVVVSMTRPNLNAVALVSPQFDHAVGSTAFHVLRANGVDPSWLFRAVQTREFIEAMTAAVQGALYPAIRPKDIRSWTLPIPPLAEQQRIADALDELFSDLDAGVAALERAREKLKLYRASVLKAAVEGALTAEWREQHPDTEPATKLLERILAERRRRWEEDQLAKFTAKDQEPPKNWKAKYRAPVAPDLTGLPPLPALWCWASFDQIGETQGGLQKSPARAPVVRHHPYLRVANVLRGRLDLSVLRRFELSDDELNRLRLEPGDVLIVEGNGSRTEIGRCALWRGEIADCVHQNHIIRVRPVSGMLPSYVDAYLNSPLGQLAIQLVASSTSGLYTLSVGKIEALAIALAPTAEQETIVEIVEDQLSVIDHLEADIDAKLKAAQGLRQAILHHAFTGRLVPQDPNDEPASELLKRFAAEREARARSAMKAKQPKKKAVKQ